MRDDRGALEGLLSGAGTMIAAAAITLVICALFRSTSPADTSIALRSVAADICGDIGTVAASVVPCNRSETYPAQGTSIRVSHDYVIAGGRQGREFARPLAVSVYPGSYDRPGHACWNDTSDLRAVLNRTFGAPGTRESPFSPGNGSKAAELLEAAGLDMGVRPVVVSPHEPLVLEKIFLYAYNDTSGTMEGRPYVFVYQR